MAYRMQLGESTAPERAMGDPMSAADADEADDDNFDGWAEEVQPTRALFPDDPATFPSADAALEHAQAQGCDLRALIALSLIHI